MLKVVIGATRDIRRLEETSLRVDAVLRMSTPPAHLSGRTLFPGALLAVLVTVAGLLALGVVIAVGPDGPARLWLGGGGSTVNLKPREVSSSGAVVPGGPVGLLAGAPATPLGDAVTLAGPGPGPGARAERPGAVRLRANTRVQRRSAARTPSASRPRTPAPTSTPAPLRSGSQTAPTAARPVASPAPASSVDKTRGRGTAPAETEVPKQRVNQQAAPTPTPAPAPADSSGPTPRSAPTPAPTSAPATEMRPVHAGGQPSTGVGTADGVHHREPPTHP
jgi:hypothetical protein